MSDHVTKTASMAQGAGGTGEVTRVGEDTALAYAFSGG